MLTAAALFVASSARAQSSIHAFGSTSVGYNDNIFNAPDEPRPELPPKVGDAFISVTPGLLFVHEGPRLRLQASYQRPVTFYLDTPGNDFSADNATIIGEAAVTESDTVNVVLAGTRTTTRATPIGQPQDSRLTTITAEPLSFLNLNLTETWWRTFSERWSGSQAASVGLLIPIDSEQQVRGDLAATLGATYRWGPSAVELETGVVTAIVPGTDEDDDPLFREDRAPVIVRATAGYRHDLSETWAASARIGGVVARDPSLEETYVGPIWGAGLSMSLDDYRATLTYDRVAAPALLTGLTTLSDVVALNGSVPLSREYFIAVLASVGFSAGRQIAVDDALSSPFNTLLADAGVGWLDPKYPNVLVRYAHFRQFGVDDDILTITNFATHQVLGTVLFTIPSLQRLPPIGRPRVRNDDADPKPAD